MLKVLQRGNNIVGNSGPREERRSTRNGKYIDNYKIALFLWKTSL